MAWSKYSHTPTNHEFIVPDWAEDFVTRWIKRLGITHEVQLAIDSTPSRDIHAVATCTSFVDSNLFTVRVKPELTDTTYWRVALLHELLHGRFMQLIDFVTEVAFKEIPEGPLRPIEKQLHVLNESLVSELSVALYKAFESIDYPDECSGNGNVTQCKLVINISK